MPFLKYLAYEGATESPIEVQKQGTINTKILDGLIFKYYFYEEMLSKPEKYQQM